MITGSFGNISYQGISIDTRTLQPGNLFFAVKGGQFDGHDFLEEAKNKKAAGAVISRVCPCDLPVVQVKDTNIALGEITKQWREKFPVLNVIGVTGSNGKTTTKNMVHALLKKTGQSVLATRGNLNNHLGLPLMLARISEQQTYAVLEMGMNHLHEIAYLTKLAMPNVALITNAGLSHLAGVGGTLAHIANAKGEIFQGLKPDGLAVINQDDPFAAQWIRQVQSKNARQNIMTFGFDTRADVRGERKLNMGSNSFILHYNHQEILIHLSLPGQHNIANALAASVVGLFYKLSFTEIKEALENIAPEKSRFEKRKCKYNLTLIDDTYNANPFSLKAAIQTLGEIARPHQKKILILGDMRELGEQEILQHQACGEYAKENGIDFLLATGELTRHTANSFGSHAQHFESKIELIKFLLTNLDQFSEGILLIKGSNSMQMHKIVEALL